MPGQSAHRLLREGDDETGWISGVAIRDRAGETREISARLVVAADGRDSRLARLADLPSETRPNNRFLYFAHYRNLHLASGKKSQMWLLEPDAAYAFPNDDGVTLLLCMPSREKLPAFKKDLEGSFARFLEGLPEGPQLAGAERVSKFMGATNLVNRSRPAAKTASPSSATRRSGRTPCGASAAAGPSSPPNGSRTRSPPSSRTAATSKGRSPATARSTGRSSPDTTASSPTSPRRHIQPYREAHVLCGG